MSKNKPGTAVTIVAVAVSALIGNYAVREFFGGDIPIDKALKTVSQETNKSLPVEIDSETRFDTTMAIGDTFYYKYTLINYTASEVKTEQFVSKMQPMLKNGYCTSDSMKQFLDNGVTVQYIYYGKEGKQIASIEVQPSACKS